MKKLSLNVNLENIELDDEAKKMNYKEIVINIIKNIINAYALQNKGIDYDEQRKFYKIYDKMEEAIKNQSDYIEFEDSWFDFIVKAKKGAKLMPNILINRVIDLIEQAELSK